MQSLSLSIPTSFRLPKWLAPRGGDASSPQQYSNNHHNSTDNCGNAIRLESRSSTSSSSISSQSPSSWSLPLTGSSSIRAQTLSTRWAILKRLTALVYLLENAEAGCGDDGDEDFDDGYSEEHHEDEQMHASSDAGCWEYCGWWGCGERCGQQQQQGKEEEDEMHNSDDSYYDHGDTDSGYGSSPQSSLPSSASSSSSSSTPRRINTTIQPFTAAIIQPPVTTTATTTTPTIAAKPYPFPSPRTFQLQWLYQTLENSSERTVFELRTLWIAILEHVKREQTLGEGLFGWEVERMVEVEVRERFSSVGKGMDGGFGERPKCARRSTTGEKLRAIREEKEEEEEEDEKGKCGMGWNSKME